MSQSTDKTLSGTSTTRSPVTVSVSISKIERFYRPELDVLRFFAFFSVFTFHAVSPANFLPGQRYWAPIGGYGMPLFFFLSSYLITELLLREKQATGTVHIKAFYLRRVLRIWPLYFFFVAAMTLFGHFVMTEYHVRRQGLLALLLLAGNWYAVKHGTMPGPIGPLWSISLEEQFYLVWPTIAKTIGRRGLLWFSVIVLFVAWATMYILGPVPLRQEERFWCNSFVQFQFFAIGALTSIFMRTRAPWRLSLFLRGLLFLSGLAAWIYAGTFAFASGDNPVRFGAALFWYIGMGVGCLLFFFSLIGIPQKWIPKQLLYLGKISYGLYVFHEIGLYASDNLRMYFAGHDLRWFAVRYIGSFAVALGLAAASYKYFESPFLKLKERFAFIRSRPA